MDSLFVCFDTLRGFCWYFDAGTIPAQLSTLTQLKVLFLDFNGLTGKCLHIRCSMTDIASRLQEVTHICLLARPFHLWCDPHFLSQTSPNHGVVGQRASNVTHDPGRRTQWMVFAWDVPLFGRFEVLDAISSVTLTQARSGCSCKA